MFFEPGFYNAIDRALHRTLVDENIIEQINIFFSPGLRIKSNYTTCVLQNLMLVEDNLHQ
jgi:hypothetical protein